MANQPAFDSPLAALEEAVRRANGQAGLARKINDLIEDPERHISQPNVWWWLHKSKKTPSGMVLLVERATGLSRHDLRPDLYPRGEAA